MLKCHCALLRILAHGPELTILKRSDAIIAFAALLTSPSYRNIAHGRPCGRFTLFTANPTSLLVGYYPHAGKVQA